MIDIPLEGSGYGKHALLKVWRVTALPCSVNDSMHSVYSESEQYYSHECRYGRVTSTHKLIGWFSSPAVAFSGDWLGIRQIHDMVPGRLLLNCQVEVGWLPPPQGVFHSLRIGSCFRVKDKPPVLQPCRPDNDLPRSGALLCDSLPPDQVAVQMKIHRKFQTITAFISRADNWLVCCLEAAAPESNCCQGTVISPLQILTITIND